MQTYKNVFNPLLSEGIQKVHLPSLNTSGYIFIIDTTHDNNNRITLQSGVDTPLPISADIFDTEFAPIGRKISDAYDNVNKRITPSTIGEFGALRLQFTTDPTLNNRNCTIKLDIGDDDSPIIIWDKTIRLARGAGEDTKVSETLTDFNRENFVNNGGRFLVNIDGVTDVYDFRILITTINIPI